MSFNKEITFAKQIERTAKRDAYLAALRWLKHYPLDVAMRHLKEKADGHTEYLRELPLVYCYATQTLVTKDNGIDGAILDEKLGELELALGESP